MPDVSVVIPAFNEAERLPRTLDRVRKFLRSRGLGYEILVVDDGSTDATADRACASGDDVHVLVNERNRGKGYSVRRGMLTGSGRLRLMTDADLSTPIEDLDRLLSAVEAGADVAIGSRATSDARVELRQGRFRETAGRLFNVFVRALLLPGIHDTQCGFKLFTARAAETAFAPASRDGFAFDVEVLVIARQCGLRVDEIGVRWSNDAATRVNLRTGLRAFLDLLTIWLNARRGAYAVEATAAHKP